MRTGTPLCGNHIHSTPTITTPNGRIVTLVSRDCCPYLDDYEPNYSPAVPAVVQSDADRVPRRNVTWDPKGPQYDEPKPYVKPTKVVLPKGGHSTDSDADVETAAPRKGGCKPTLNLLAQVRKIQTGQR